MLQQAAAQASSSPSEGMFNVKLRKSQPSKCVTNASRSKRSSLGLKYQKEVLALQNLVTSLVLTYQTRHPGLGALTHVAFGSSLPVDITTPTQRATSPTFLSNNMPNTAYVLHVQSPG
ncbi:hypothetical protein PsorP6_000127 [Peronosclerospora sorghi]|uniref:Uncharacterized protein n=1 Tax=Peronosclerospora sorghi TaxID=230839 RepID=A0ACC0WYA0_9STRA|nr:hypothetical protein PsorP6_000127 [Peronosclerospora sorghi]